MYYFLLMKKIRSKKEIRDRTWMRREYLRIYG